MESANLDTPAKPRMLSRRRMIGLGIAGTMSLLSWTRFVEPYWIDIHEQSFAVRGLPAALDGATIVQLSDFHAGITDISFLQRAMEVVNSLQADWVVLTGDFIDNDRTESVGDLPKYLRELAPPKYGAMACLGNHDFGRRWSQLEIADRVSDELAQAGVRLLQDEMIESEGLQWVGLNDLWSPRYQAQEILGSVDTSRDAICLCHNPDVCDEPVWGDYHGLILSGHTHGGQCKPPLLPPPRLPVRNRNYVAGTYKIDARKTLYINRGIGHSMPVRFNCRPEITRFTLRTMAAAS